ncbi:MAG: hypothetical protein K9G33_08400 [Sneathiella sp.]|nr:hypothetical protein [Sneathiella sp.]
MTPEYQNFRLPQLDCHAAVIISRYGHGCPLASLRDKLGFLLNYINFTPEISGFRAKI